MPFVSEEIYGKLVPEEASLMMSSWPEHRQDRDFAEAEEVVEHLKAIISGVRNIRAEMNVPAARKTKIYVVSEDDKLRAGLSALKDSVIRMASASDFIVQNDREGIAEDAVSVVVPDAAAYVPLNELVDFEQETERLTKEEARLTKEIARATGMLNNEKFMSKAPEAKVQEEKDKLVKYQQMLDQVKERLEGLKARQP